MIDILFSKLGDMNDAITQLNAEGVGYEEARVLLVNQLHITMGEATKCIEAAEEIASLRLSRNEVAEMQIAEPARPIGLTQAELETFLPNCMVCGDQLSARRARGRKETCDKPECQKALKQFRRHVLESRKCPTCYKPSTPAERQSYREWRWSTGGRRKGAGRPALKKEERIRQAMQTQLAALQEHRAKFAGLVSAEVIAGLDSLIESAQKVIDETAK
jgi:hypothetical protein